MSVASDTAPMTAEFRVGRILSQSFNLLFVDFAKFFLVALIAYVPLSVPLVLAGLRASAAGTTLPITYGGYTPGLAIGGVAALWFILFPVMQAIVIYGAFQDMRGRGFNLGEAFGRGFGRFFPLIGLMFAFGFAVLLGTILLVVPGMMMMAAFYVAIPCCVVEKKGPLQSLSRSAELTKGHRWKVFGTFIVITFGSAIIGPVVRLLFAAIGGVMVGIAAYMIWSILFMAYYLIVVTVMYNDLRIVKEGIDTERIAAVFD